MQRWRPDGSLSLIAVVQEVAISHFLCAPYLRQCGRFNLSIKFIKGHILLHIMCFIPLTQTYYAPGWRWPYESHKAGLMNMIVKSCCSVWTQCEGKVIRQKACTTKMYAYKRSLWWRFQAAEIHLLQPNGLLSPHWKRYLAWISVCYGTELKQTHSLVKDLFYAVMRWETLSP